MVVVEVLLRLNGKGVRQRGAPKRVERLLRSKYLRRGDGLGILEHSRLALCHEDDANVLCQEGATCEC